MLLQRLHQAATAFSFNFSFSIAHYAVVWRLVKVGRQAGRHQRQNHTRFWIRKVVKAMGAA